MNELSVVYKGADWRRPKVWCSIPSPLPSRSGFTTSALMSSLPGIARSHGPASRRRPWAAWRVALEARGLGAVSINVRMTVVRKLAVEAADNGLLAPELANGITRVKGAASKGVRLGYWLTAKHV